VSQGSFITTRPVPPKPGSQGENHDDGHTPKDLSRVKYPYGRGVLSISTARARATTPDPVEAWTKVVSDPEQRRAYQQTRSKGGLVRLSCPASRA
jgi:hypothetical protein